MKQATKKASEHLDSRKIFSSPELVEVQVPAGKILRVKF